MDVAGIGETSIATGNRIKSMTALLKRYYFLYLILLPGLLYFIVFKYIPMFGLIVAFKKYNLISGFWKSPWVGVDNFTNFIQGAYFWEIMENTLVISLYKIVFGFTTPILLALLLNEVTVTWFKRTIQTFTYLPHFISWVIVYGLMVALFSPGDGLVNQFLKGMDFRPIAFLTETEWARFMVVVSSIWKETGWGAILYLAALAGIDPSLYEAAKMDGANRLRQMWHVTLPGIRNVMILLLIMQMAYIMDAGFDQIYMMSNVFNQSKIEIIDTWVYREGLERMNIGLASAVGLFKSFIGLILVLGANRLAKKFDSQIW